MTSKADIVRNSFVEQSKLCKKFGSPFTSMLIDVIGQNISEETSTGRKLLHWPGVPNASGDALALRFAGALHALSNSGLSTDLSSVYPPRALPDPNDLWTTVERAIHQHDDWLLAWLDYAPQTNEVGRSAVLYPGLLEIQTQTGLPLNLYEIGASAGLNLILDRFSYHFDGTQRGDADSKVKIHPVWTGPIPSSDPLRIQSRIGCDLAPIDLTDETERSRLLAYVWPDQADRYSRIQAAIALFNTLESPPTVEQEDAATWVKRVIKPELAEGRTTVLMHSLTYCYLPDASKAEIRDHLESVGAGAAKTRPLAWLAYEFGEGSEIAATVQIWPGGQTQKLVEADAHGRQVTWLTSLSDR